jgi:hypothetical protein
MMNTHKGDIVVQRLDEWRFAFASMASCAMSAAEENVSDAPQS